VFEHFTDGARRTLVLAHGEAQSLHDRSVRPEHLLLGMVRETNGMAATALSDIGADYGRARALIEIHKLESAGLESDDEVLSKATLRVLERSLQISWAQADGGIDTEHMLAALVEENDETTETVLAGLDITPEEVMRQLNALLAERRS
jgi:ATP-dependent Clp protease ATP-binding subunit ClpC